MELDDLKSAWKHLDVSSSQHTLDSKEVLNLISQSHKRIKHAFVADVLIALGIWLSFVVVVIIFRQAVQLFLYKMVLTTVMFAIPIYYRLYRSIRFLTTIDYGKDIKTSLQEFIRYYKITIRYYQMGTYVMIGVLLILFFTDLSFLELALWIKGVIVLYLVLVSLLIQPLLKRIYWRKIESIESLLLD